MTQSRYWLHWLTGAVTIKMQQFLCSVMHARIYHRKSQLSSSASSFLHCTSKKSAGIGILVGVNVFKHLFSIYKKILDDKDMAISEKHYLTLTAKVLISVTND